MLQRGGRERGAVRPPPYGLEPPAYACKRPTLRRASDTRLFDIDVQVEPPAELLRRILGLRRERAAHRVSYVNAHVLNQSFADPELREALQRSDLVYCDGYGVRLAAG